MIVLDASAVVDLALGSPRGRRVAERLLRRTGRLQAPHLVDLEVVQAMRRLVAIGAVTEGRARAGLDAIALLPLDRHPHAPYVERIWALRRNLTAYDAAYVALAEGLDATLLTCDGRIAAAPGHRARVEVVAATPG